MLEKQKEGKKRMKQVGKRRDSAGGLPGGAQDEPRTPNNDATFQKSTLRRVLRVNHHRR
ncbi:MAG: hypothetical protein QM736_26990 [Vicinamibacterales bacterium]